MPSVEKKAGEIQGYEPNKMFDVVVETDADGIFPKYVYIRKPADGRLITSFVYGRPHHNCALSRAAAIVSGSHQAADLASIETTDSDQVEVIDLEETITMRLS